MIRDGEIYGPSWIHDPDGLDEMAPFRPRRRLLDRLWRYEVATRRHRLTGAVHGWGGALGWIPIADAEHIWRLEETVRSLQAENGRLAAVALEVAVG